MKKKYTNKKSKNNKTNQRVLDEIIRVDHAVGY